MTNIDTFGIVIKTSPPAAVLISAIGINFRGVKRSANGPPAKISDHSHQAISREGSTQLKVRNVKYREECRSKDPYNYKREHKHHFPYNHKHDQYPNIFNLHGLCKIT
ncbi:MAG: hypothetical protein RIC35_09920 [Marinoscillum sp.]